jgi:hypothetical protein
MMITVGMSRRRDSVSPTASQMAVSVFFTVPALLGVADVLQEGGL